MNQQQFISGISEETRTIRIFWKANSNEEHEATEYNRQFVTIATSIKEAMTNLYIVDKYSKKYDMGLLVDTELGYFDHGEYQSSAKNNPPCESLALGHVSISFGYYESTSFDE